MWSLQIFLGVRIAKTLNSATRRRGFGRKLLPQPGLSSPLSSYFIGPGLLQTCDLFCFKTIRPKPHCRVRPHSAALVGSTIRKVSEGKFAFAHQRSRTDSVPQNGVSIAPYRMTSRAALNGRTRNSRTWFRGSFWCCGDALYVAIAIASGSGFHRVATIPVTESLISCCCIGLAPHCAILPMDCTAQTPHAEGVWGEIWTLHESIPLICWMTI